MHLELLKMILFLINVEYSFPVSLRKYLDLPTFFLFKEENS